MANTIKEKAAVNDKVGINILDTIELFKKKYQFPTDAALAKAIGISPSTWTSFISKPSSMSKAKSAFCSYFNINPLDMDSGKLLEEEKNNKNEESAADDWGLSIPSENEVPLIKTETYDIFTKALLHCHDISDPELYALNQDVIKKLRFKMTMILARKHITKRDYINAFMAYNSAFLDLNESNVDTLLKTDLQNFVLMSEKMNDVSGLSALVEKLTSDELYRVNIVYFLSGLLEEHFSELSRKCLRAVLQKE